MRPKREYDHAFPRGVEVKNEWNFSSTIPVSI
jgi:hypothetical protein